MGSVKVIRWLGMPFRWRNRRTRPPTMRGSVSCALSNRGMGARGQDPVPGLLR
jgi:hypothetical protein